MFNQGFVPQPAPGAPYPQAPMYPYGYGANGYNYAPPAKQARMTQLLSNDQKSLLRSGDAFDLSVTPVEMAKALCTHKDNGKYSVVPVDGENFRCTICGQQFRCEPRTKQEVEDACALFDDIFNQIKLYYLDIPEEVAKQLYQISALTKKIAPVYEISKSNWITYNNQNPQSVYANSVPYGIDALGGILGGAVPFSNPMAFGQPNPGFAPGQYQYPQAPVAPMGYPTPGVPYPSYPTPQGMPMQQPGQPMTPGFAENPFGFYGAPAVPQGMPMQQPGQPMAAPVAPAVPQTAQAPVAETATVTKQFNV